MIAFEVEQTLQIEGTAYLFARVLGSWDEIVVRDGSTLDGAPLHLHLDFPRAFDAAGEPRMDVFVFALRDADDLRRFAAGQQVLLETPDQSSTPGDDPRGQLGTNGAGRDHDPASPMVGICR